MLKFFAFFAVCTLSVFSQDIEFNDKDDTYQRPTQPEKQTKLEENRSLLQFFQLGIATGSLNFSDTPQGKYLGFVQITGSLISSHQKSSDSYLSLIPGILTISKDGLVHFEVALAKYRRDEDSYINSLDIFNVKYDDRNLSEKEIKVSFVAYKYQKNLFPRKDNSYLYIGAKAEVGMDFSSITNIENLTYHQKIRTNDFLEGHQETLSKIIRNYGEETGSQHFNSGNGRPTFQASALLRFEQRFRKMKTRFSLSLKMSQNLNGDRKKEIYSFSEDPKENAVAKISKNFGQIDINANIRKVFKNGNYIKVFSEYTPLYWRPIKIKTFSSDLKEKEGITQWSGYQEKLKIGLRFNF